MIDKHYIKRKAGSFEVYGKKTPVSDGVVGKTLGGLSAGYSPVNRVEERCLLPRGVVFEDGRFWYRTEDASRTPYTKL